MLLGAAASAAGEEVCFCLLLQPQFQEKRFAFAYCCNLSYKEANIPVTKEKIDQLQPQLQGRV
jgi:hypothetical protein